MQWCPGPQVAEQCTIAQLHYPTGLELLRSDPTPLTLSPDPQQCFTSEVSLPQNYCPPIFSVLCATSKRKWVVAPCSNPTHNTWFLPPHSFLQRSQCLTSSCSRPLALSVALFLGDCLLLVPPLDYLSLYPQPGISPVAPTYIHSSTQQAFISTDFVPNSIPGLEKLQGALPLRFLPFTYNSSLLTQPVTVPAHLLISYSVPSAMSLTLQV
jgi:hypothetical protein